MSARVAAVLSLCLLTLGCNPANPPVGPPLGPGLGAPCDDGKCRAGFTCNTALTCEGSRATADGQPCTLGVECVSGTCAPAGARGQCAPAGTGTEGTTCQGDGDCAAGLKCGFDGVNLFPRCLLAGGGDVGSSCTRGAECAQGLLCVSGACATASLTAAMTPHGYPPVLPQVPGTGWQGASCPAPKASAQVALWSLPRDTDDASLKQDFYRLPFPNDALRAANGVIDFSRHPKDPSPSFGFDLLGRYLDALQGEPFGNAPTIIFRFDGPVDFQSIVLTAPNPNVRLVKLETGQTFPHGLSLVLNGSPNRYVCSNWLAVRPFEGDSLTKGTWAVILLKGLKGSSGMELQPAADFSAMLEATAPTEARQAKAWPAYQKLRDALPTMSIDPANVLAATVFTVEDPQRLVKRVVAGVAAADLPTATAWVKCGSGTPSPCESDAGARTCGPDTDGGVEEWHARLTLPIFQRGEAPYLTPEQGGGIPTQDPLVAERTEPVCASLTVPVGAPPDGGWPVVLYAHGTGGSFRSHAADGSGAALSGVALAADGGTETLRAAVFGFDQVGHGPRTHTSGPTPTAEDLVFNFSNPASARGTMAQGAADLHAVTRYLESLAATPPAGLPALDVSHLAFWGHSQGATEGALFLAQDRAVEGALLSGASALLVNSLTSKQKPVDIAGGLWLVLNESRPEAVTAYHPVLSLLQAWSDPVDPVHFAGSAAVMPADPPRQAFARHVFQVWGKDDLFTPRPVQSAFALGARLAFVGPQVEDLAITPVRTSVVGNVMSPRIVTAAVRQYVPPTGTDGHFVVFSNAAATADASHFIARVLRGEIPVIPEP